ncbi:MAG: RNA methyltransferase, partial [Pseudomonadota bacterium]|nr:RNA methyltransferase [Pseudomonadota bacterium]
MKLAILPTLLLVRPQMGENIGAVARAMSNFGLKELRLCTPRDGWPNPKAREMAAGAEYVVESANIYPDFRGAMADIHIAYATTARPRDMEKRVIEPA